jgi:hypothetical protein
MTVPCDCAPPIAVILRSEATKDLLKSPGSLAALGMTVDCDRVPPIAVILRSNATKDPELD